MRFERHVPAPGPRLDGTRHPPRVGDLWLLARLVPTASERDAGLLEVPLYGAFVGRDPRDVTRWVVVPVDAVPVAAVGDVFLAGDEADAAIGGVWARGAETFAIAAKDLRGGEAGGSLTRAQVNRIARALAGGAPSMSPTDEDLAELEDVPAIGISRVELAAAWRDLPLGEKGITALLRALLHTGPVQAVRTDASGQGQRLAAATSPEPRLEAAFRGADGRRVVLRVDVRAGDVLVMSDPVDDVAEVRINGRLAAAEIAGHRATTDLAANEGMVVCVIRTTLDCELSCQVEVPEHTKGRLP